MRSVATRLQGMAHNLRIAHNGPGFLQWHSIVLPGNGSHAVAASIMLARHEAILYEAIYYLLILPVFAILRPFEAYDGPDFGSMGNDPFR